MKKKFLALVMTLSMVLSLVPMTALAAGDGQADSVAAGSQSTSEGANGSSQDSNSNTGGDNSTGGSEDSADTNKAPDANPENNGEGKDSESGSTGGTTSSGSSENGTEGSGSTKGGSTTTEGSGAGGGTVIEPTEPETPTEPEAPKNAAQIGENKYPTVADAMAAAKPGDTIVLLRNVTESITINKSLTLDLAGFTLTAEENNRVIDVTPDVALDKNDFKQYDISELSFPNIAFGLGFFAEGKAENLIKKIVIPQIDVKIMNGIITGGDVTGRKGNNSRFYGGGGGIRISSCNVEIVDCTITGNKAESGGGIFCSTSVVNGQPYSKVVITGCKISDNTACASGDQTISAGGGISSCRCDLTLNGLTVSGNKVNESQCDGGGISARGGKFYMENTTVQKNEAADNAGGILLGAVIEPTVKEPIQYTITGGTVANNESKTSGGGIWVENESSQENRHEDNKIIGTTVEKNIAGFGGGISVGTNAKLTVEGDALILNNKATNTYMGGGGIYATIADLHLGNARITNNEAINGGGIFAQSAGLSKAELALSDGAQVEGNHATNGGGIFVRALGTSTMSAEIGDGASVKNNVAENGGGIYVTNGATFNVAEGSALYNNTAKDAGDDLFLNGAIFTLPKASEMSGDKQFKISEAENGTVTGWFYDGWFKWDPNAPSASGEAETKGAYVEAARWSMDKADEYSPKGNDTQAIALKAATKKAPSPGGGGGGGSHKPTVTIPDDVPTGLNGKDHYAYVVGYPDGMVYPQKNITRAEVATIFFRLLEDETREANMTKSNGYNDMKDGAWYTCAVSTLSKMGIIKGYEDGSFKPDASISRAEFAAIAARFDPDGDTTPATFSDVSSHWAKDEISIAANHGWIKGYEDGSFKPDQKITRAETMTLVNRVLKRLPETKDDLHKDMKTWPDNQNESAWFYLAVQEATNSHYQNLKKDGTHEKWESMRETRDWAALEK